LRDREGRRVVCTERLGGGSERRKEDAAAEAVTADGGGMVRYLWLVVEGSLSA
jgi:hypothetical protein